MDDGICIVDSNRRLLLNNDVGDNFVSEISNLSNFYIDTTEEKQPEIDTKLNEGQSNEQIFNSNHEYEEALEIYSAKPKSEEKRESKRYSLGWRMKTEESKIGGLIELGRNHPLALFSMNIVFCLVNLVVMLVCMNWDPDWIKELKMPELPRIDFTMGLNATEIKCDPCVFMAVLVPIAFLLTPFLLINYIKANDGAYRRIKDSNINGKIQKSKLVEFIYQHSTLVFWSGYSLTLLNAVLLLCCYCGVPSLNLPSMELPRMALPKIALPSMALPSIDFSLSLRPSDMACDPCVFIAGIVSVMFLLVIPFFLACPKSPLYTTKKYMRSVSKNNVASYKHINGESDELMIKTEKERKDLAEFVSKNSKVVFWTCYSLAYLNAILLWVCYCDVPSITLPGLPSITLPNICDIKPISFVCVFIACLVNCAKNA